ncbi:MAG: hypothetical protein IPK33_22140 [Gemmatimonadetes bacterium]|nr:hypothetical protein [Gemmatimonadota bacterium]
MTKRWAWLRRLLVAFVLLSAVQLLAMQVAFPFAGQEHHALLNRIGGFERPVLRVWWYDMTWLSAACFLLIAVGNALSWQTMGILGAIVAASHWLEIIWLVTPSPAMRTLLHFPIPVMQASILSAAWLGDQVHRWWQRKRARGERWREYELAAGREVKGVKGWWQSRFPPRAKICPKCGGDRVVDVTYGYPMPGRDMTRGGGAVHHGCVVGPDSPTAACLDCRYAWQDPVRRLPIDW